MMRTMTVGGLVLGLGLVLGTVGAAAKPACIKAGGIGNGVSEGIASFMSEAAVKNQAKAWGGDAVKIGKIATKCTGTLLVECTSSARACK